MTTFTAKNCCDHEDESGRRCMLGPGHRTPHLVGKQYRPTEVQARLLAEISRFSVRKFQCIGLTTVASLKALSRRGFIRLHYINSRAWDASLTPAGQRLLIDLPK